MSNASELVSSLRNAFNSGKTKPLAYRAAQLRALLRLYKENTPAMVAALHADLRKSRMESIVTEIQYLINDLENTLAHLSSWAQPQPQPKDLANLLDGLRVHSDPYGVALVIGSWNYPIQLTLLPVHGAIAAGNCVVIKPSEVSGHSARFIAATIPRYLDADCFRVFEGGPAETALLLAQRLDYIFYTGSTRVGQLVHQAANRFLTPCTLELGGKSPAFVDKSADLGVSARRLLWGKFINAGQTCVAPDYLLCTPETRDLFVEEAKRVIREFFGEKPAESPDLGRIISKSHYGRLVELLRGQEIAVGGQCDADDLYIAPTILYNCKMGDPVMREEVFGPILPIVTVSGVGEAIEVVNAGEKPLCLYVFAGSRVVVEKMVAETSSGGVCVNDTIMQMATEMPFGGVGMSGMGAYHGKATFDTFSHQKSVLYKDLGWLGEVLSKARYPPYTNGKLVYLNMMLKKRGIGGLGAILRLFAVFGAGFVAAFLANKYLKG